MGVLPEYKEVNVYHSKDHHCWWWGHDLLQMEQAETGRTQTYAYTRHHTFPPRKTAVDVSMREVVVTFDNGVQLHFYKGTCGRETVIVLDTDEERRVSYHTPEMF